MAANDDPAEGTMTRQQAFSYLAGLLAPALAAAAPLGASAQDLDAALFTQPEDVPLYDEMPREDLVALGEELYSDPSLSPNGNDPA